MILQVMSNYQLLTVIIEIKNKLAYESKKGGGSELPLFRGELRFPGLVLSPLMASLL